MIKPIEREKQIKEIGISLVMMFSMFSNIINAIVGYSDSITRYEQTARRLGPKGLGRFIIL